MSNLFPEENNEISESEKFLSSKFVENDSGLFPRLIAEAGRRQQHGEQAGTAFPQRPPSPAKPPYKCRFQSRNLA